MFSNHHHLRSLHTFSIVSSLCCPLGGSSEHPSEPWPASEGLRLQELRPAAGCALPLSGGLPAQAVAGHTGLLSSPGLLPGVHAGQ